MVSLTLLIVIVVGVVVLVARSRGAGPTARKIGSPGAHTDARQDASPAPAVVSGLAAALERWVEAGLLTEDQSTAIEAYESAAVSRPPPWTGPTPSTSVVGRLRSTRVPVVAEALGYLGGALATVGLVLVVSRYWPDMTTAGRLALSGAAAALLGVAGLLVHEDADPALARLRSVLWLASTAAAALFAGVLAADGLGADSPETIVASCAGAVAAVSGVMWGWRDRPLQQLVALAGAVVCIGASVAHVAAPGPVGLSVWAMGAILLVMALREVTPLPWVTEVVGAVALIAGGGIASSDVDGVASAWMGFGLLLVVASAVLLVAIAVMPGLAPTGVSRLIAAIVGGIALLQGLPATLAYFAQQAGLVTGLTVWLVGIALMFVGATRRTRVPMVLEGAGAVALLGGAALTGAQFTGFAVLFGCATAVGLIIAGMRPGQVMLSAFGSLGLLVNVPWAIGWYFPGENRAPLLILVSGALILAVAVLLARMGGRFKEELGRHDRSGNPSDPLSAR